MPQLDPATFVPQLVWLAITFVLLYLLMAKVGLPKVAAVVEARRHRIEHDLAEARRMSAEAETIMASYERALADARSAAQANLRETMDRMAAESTEQIKRASDALGLKVAEAEARIHAAKDGALANVRDVAIDIARDITTKLTGAPADDKRAAAAVDAALSGRA